MPDGKLILYKNEFYNYTNKIVKTIPNSLNTAILLKTDKQTITASHDSSALFMTPIDISPKNININNMLFISIVPISIYVSYNGESTEDTVAVTIDCRIHSDGSSGETTIRYGSTNLTPSSSKTIYLSPSYWNPLFLYMPTEQYCYGIYPTLSRNGVVNMQVRFEPITSSRFSGVCTSTLQYKYNVLYYNAS